MMKVTLQSADVNILGRVKCNPGN